MLKDSIESLHACNIEIIGNIVDEEVINAFCKLRKIHSPQYVLPRDVEEKALSESVDVLLVMLNFAPNKVKSLTISRLTELAGIPSSKRAMSMKKWVSISFNSFRKTISFNSFRKCKKKNDEKKVCKLRDKVFNWLRFTDHKVDNMTDDNIRFLAKSAGLTLPIGKLKDESLREKITNETLEWSRDHNLYINSIDDSTMQALWRVTGTPMPKKSFTPGDKRKAMGEAIDMLRKKGIKSRHNKYGKEYSQERKKFQHCPQIINLI